VLTNDMAVEFRNDFSGCHRGHGAYSIQGNSCGWRASSKNFNGVVHIGVNAQFAGDFQRLLDYLLG